MSNGNNGFGIDGLRALIDELYASRNVVLTDMPRETAEKFNSLKSAVGLLYTTDDYPKLVEILKSYPDRTYLPETIGQYLFGCIDIEPDKISCIPICAKSILPTNAEYRACQWPTYKINDDGSIALQSNGTNGRSEVAIVISSTGVLSQAAANVLKDNGIKTVYVYGGNPARHVTTVDLTQSTPIPPADGKVGKKGKDALGKELKKGGKSSWLNYALIIGGVIIAIGIIWWLIGGKGKNNSGSNNANNGPKVESIPQQVPPRSYVPRNGGFFPC